MSLFKKTILTVFALMLIALVAVVTVITSYDSSKSNKGTKGMLPIEAASKAVEQIQQGSGVNARGHLRQLLGAIKNADKVEIYSDNMVKQTRLAGYDSSSPKLVEIKTIIASASGKADKAKHLKGYVLNWYGAGDKLAEVFVQQGTGILEIRYIKNAEIDNPGLDRIFIPEDQYKALTELASPKALKK